MIDGMKVQALADRIVERCSEASNDEWAQFQQEFKALDGAERVSCWAKVTKVFQADGAPWARSKVAHKHLGLLVLEVFNVPPGTAGIGVQPTVNGHRILDRKDDRPGAEVIDELLNSPPGPHGR